MDATNPGEYWMHRKTAPWMPVPREGEPESPVRMFRRWDSVRVEMVDVTETSRGWDGFLFRGVTMGNVRHPRGESCYCTKKKWTELAPEKGG